MTRDDNSTHILAFTTLGSKAEATRLLRELIERRIIACGTAITGATSLYRWQGETVEESEIFVVLKTVRGRWQDLEDAIAELHPYRVPELIAAGVEFGLPSYLEWITQETKPNGAARPHG